MHKVYKVNNTIILATKPYNEEEGTISAKIIWDLDGNIGYNLRCHFEGESHIKVFGIDRLKPLPKDDAKNVAIDIIKFIERMLNKVSATTTIAEWQTSANKCKLLIYPLSVIIKAI